MSLKGFHNLSSFELYSLHDENGLTRDLVDVLISCPSLKVLGLGLAREWDANEDLLMLREADWHFLYGLCILYGNEPSSSPLELRELKIGHGMPFHQGNKDLDSRYLSKLVATNDLELLQLANSCVTIHYEEDEVDVFGNLSSLRLGDCPALRRLWIGRMTEDADFSSRIRDFSRLARLSLQARKGQLFPYPSPQSSRWPYIKNPRTISQKYAELLANQSPLLQYIEIGEWAWRIRRDASLNDIQGPIPEYYHLYFNEDIAEQVWRLDYSRKLELPFSLEELDDDEKEQIYLFNLPKLISRSALGGQRPGWDFPETLYY
ncbi:hypothetical protein NHQ30_002437 [Ciborinia camelliae]|nr:hypothetical protein NHQ30_002437 [Ciborinia camelliae]